MQMGVLHSVHGPPEVLGAQLYIKSSLHVSIL